MRRRITRTRNPNTITAMINYTHDDIWKRNLCQAIDISLSTLKSFGIGETKDISVLIAAEVKDKSSDFRRFLEVFYDESLFSAELSLAAKKAGNKEAVYNYHAKNKKQKSANKAHFVNALHASNLYCRMSGDYGVEFAMLIGDTLNRSFAHLGFLQQFYETVMDLAWFDSVEEGYQSLRSQEHQA